MSLTSFTNMRTRTRKVLWKTKQQLTSNKQKSNSNRDAIRSEKFFGIRLDALFNWREERCPPLLENILVRLKERLRLRRACTVLRITSSGLVREMDTLKYEIAKEEFQKGEGEYKEIRFEIKKKLITARREGKVNRTTSIPTCVLFQIARHFFLSLPQPLLPPSLLKKTAKTVWRDYHHDMGKIHELFRSTGVTAPALSVLITVLDHLEQIRGSEVPEVFSMTPGDDGLAEALYSLLSKEKPIENERIFCNLLINELARTNEFQSKGKLRTIPPLVHDLVTYLQESVKVENVLLSESINEFMNEKTKSFFHVIKPMLSRNVPVSILLVNNNLEDFKVALYSLLKWLDGFRSAVFSPLFPAIKTMDFSKDLSHTAAMKQILDNLAVLEQTERILFVKICHVTTAFYSTAGAGQMRLADIFSQSLFGAPPLDQVEDFLRLMSRAKSSDTKSFL